MRHLLLLALLALGACCALAGGPPPTCKLNSLQLLTDDDTPLVFRDDEGAGYNHGSNTYFCNCDNTVSKVRAVLTSDQATDKSTVYNLEFTNGENDNSEQYIKHGVVSSPLHFRAITNRIVIRAFNNNCNSKVTIHCVQTPDDGEAIGDPQFAGLRGQDYQVHGVSGEVYNIITDADLQMNSKFVFLEQGQCPTFSGERAMGCWSHAGSYLGEIGIKTAAGDRVKIVSGDYQSGFAAVELNGQPMEPGMTATLPALDGGAAGFVTFNHSFVVSVQAGNFLLQFENSDMFINQRVRVLDWSKLASHGLLGQTWRKVEYKNAIKYVEGTPDDYVVAAKDLFGDEFLFNRFEQKAEGQAVAHLIDSEEQAAQSLLMQAAESAAVLDAKDTVLDAPVPAPDLFTEIVHEGSGFMSGLLRGAQSLLGSKDEYPSGAAEEELSALELALPFTDDPNVLVAEIKEGAYEPDPVDATAHGRKRESQTQIEPAQAQEEEPRVPHNGEEESYELFAEIKEGAYSPDPLDSTAAGRAQSSVSVSVPASGEQQPAFGIALEPVAEAPPAEAHRHGRRKKRRTTPRTVLTDTV